MHYAPTMQHALNQPKRQTCFMEDGDPTAPGLPTISVLGRWVVLRRWSFLSDVGLVARHAAAGSVA